MAVHDAGDGPADQDVDQRRSLADVPAERVADPQRPHRVVPFPLGDLITRTNGQDDGDVAEALYFGEQQADPLGTVLDLPVTILAAGGRLDLVEQVTGQGQLFTHLIHRQFLQRRLQPIGPVGFVDFFQQRGVFVKEAMAR